MLERFYKKENIHRIENPGTLEGGDVMMVGDHFYVGRSERTNEGGIRQFIAILEKYGLSGSEVTLEEVLHLKTGVNYLWTAAGYAGGLTVLLDAEGKPIVTPVPAEDNED